MTSSFRRTVRIALLSLPTVALALLEKWEHADFLRGIWPRGFDLINGHGFWVLIVMLTLFGLFVEFRGPNEETETQKVREGFRHLARESKRLSEQLTVALSRATQVRSEDAKNDAWLYDLFHILYDWPVKPNTTETAVLDIYETVGGIMFHLKQIDDFFITWALDRQWQEGLPVLRVTEVRDEVRSALGWPPGTPNISHQLDQAQRRMKKLCEDLAPVLSQNSERLEELAKHHKTNFSE